MRTTTNKEGQPRNSPYLRSPEFSRETEFECNCAGDRAGIG